jgi:DNA-binding CsgD family transcriptional regulator
LVGWLDAGPDGLCVVDCADGYRVVYANRAASSWAPEERLRPGAGGLLEAVGTAWASGEAARLREFPIGVLRAEGARLWDVEVQPLGDPGEERRYVLVRATEASRAAGGTPAVSKVKPIPLRVIPTLGVSRVDHRARVRISQRELQVAELVALGLTNAEIAARLFLSRATVASHIAGLLTKLRFRSRAQVAVWVVEQRQHEAVS